MNFLYFRKPQAHSCKRQTSYSGFTLIELLIVIGITVILASTSIPIWGNLQLFTHANESGARIGSVLRLARERAMAGRDDSNWGVFFNLNGSTPLRFVLYKGDSYALRDESNDTVFEMDPSIIAESSWVGNEVNFFRGSGLPSQTGHINLSQYGNVVRTVSVNELGIVD